MKCLNRFAVCFLGLSMVIVGFVLPEGSAQPLDVFERPQSMASSTIKNVVSTNAWEFTDSRSQVAQIENMCFSPEGYLACLDVRPEPGKSSVKFFSATGKKVREIKGLTLPSSVALDSRGNLIVLSRSSLIQKYSPKGELVVSWNKEKGKGQLQFPVLLVIDSQDNMIVLDKETHCLNRYSRDGNFLNAFGGADLDGPLGLAITPKGELLVLDTDGRLVVFTPQGRVSRKLNLMKDIDPNVTALTLGLMGDIIIVGTVGTYCYNYFFNAKGEILGRFAGIGKKPSDPAMSVGASGAFAYRDNRIFVLDLMNFRIMVFQVKRVKTP